VSALAVLPVACQKSEDITWLHPSYAEQVVDAWLRAEAQNSNVWDAIWSMPGAFNPILIDKSEHGVTSSDVTRRSAALCAH
jgi:hypothetical protein